MKLDRGKVKIFFFMVFEFLNQNQVYPLKMTFMFSKTRNCLYSIEFLGP